MGTTQKPATPEYLLVGEVLRPHGVRGALLLQVLTEFPDRLKDQEFLYLGPRRRKFRVAQAGQHGREILLSLAEITDRDTAEVLRGLGVYIRVGDAGPLPPGRFYHHQVEGLEVVADTGERLGTVARIMETGANDVYVVRDEAGRETLLPAIPAVIRKYDLETGRLLVHLLEGLR